MTVVARDDEAIPEIAKPYLAGGRHIRRANDANFSAHLDFALRQVSLNFGHVKVDYPLILSGHSRGIAERKKACRINAWVASFWSSSL